MSQESLTARYRPQNFAQVAGQDAVKRILSRAASTGRVAPAYLFSGTRGVGKTTLARIFAKALNCRNGPAEEPCNACPVCRQITLGAAVDVVEIDGASNTGVDNVRRLKEDVGYAPLECRYKVIIIDEAHMLSKAAFNALLKTLEEPPGHVTFILATTEPEKFPQTIISRCQHFVFKRLPLSELSAHLLHVLALEHVEAEPAAVHLIARRGAGSVRDSMSLLAQVLALGSTSLTLSDVREVLGLAGQEVFLRLVECVCEQNIAGLSRLLGEILDQGLDLGFFLRELGGCWRNLFLLRRLGDAARDMLDLPVEEVEAWARWAPRFAQAHVHAAWQMTLDAQRKVLTSMEPGLAMELLLINLATLPELLALDAPGNTEGTASSGRTTAGPRPQPVAGSVSRPVSPPSASVRPGAGPQQEVPSRDEATDKCGPAACAREQGAAFVATSARRSVTTPGVEAAVVEDTSARAATDIPRTWPGFLQFLQSRSEAERPRVSLEKVSGALHGSELVLSSPHAFLCERLRGALPQLAGLVREFFGPETTLRVEEPPAAVVRSRAELRDMARVDAVVRDAQEHFQARIVEVRPVPNTKLKEKMS